MAWLLFYMGVSENRGVSPQIIHFTRVFHYFHHPFWVFSPYFRKHPYSMVYPPIMLQTNGSKVTLSGGASSSDFLLHCTSGLDATTCRLYATAKMLGMYLNLGGGVQIFLQWDGRGWSSNLQWEFIYPL